MGDDDGEGKGAGIQVGSMLSIGFALGRSAECLRLD